MPSSSNAINGTNVYVIHAQTSKFSVEDGVCAEEEVAAPTLPVCLPVTVTETATVTVTPACSGTLVAVPTSDVASPTGSEAPGVTAAPSLDDAEGGEDAITSTVYSTVYKDLSEVEDCVHMCEA